MIIGAGPLQVPAYIEAKKMGLRTVAIDRDPNAPAMKIADSAYTVDTRDPDGAIATAKKEDISGVLTLCTDAPMVSVAAVNNALGLAGLRPEQALKATHKGLMRDALLEGKAPIPRYYRTFSTAEIKTAIKKMGLPVILKPTQSSGSRGIYKLESLDNLETALTHVRVIAGPHGEVLVEEFIDGPEVSIETISCAGCHHIVMITDKVTSGSPYWVEMGHSQPSMLPENILNAIKDASCKGLSALGIMQSPSHVEIKIDATGPKIMEIGARLGGDYITAELVPRSTGVNMIKAAISLALGENPDITPTRTQGSSIRYIIGTSGRITNIMGIEAAKSIPGVKIVELLMHEGDIVPMLSSSLDRQGYVIAEGQDAESAIRTAEHAKEKIIIKTEHV